MEEKNYAPSALICFFMSFALSLPLSGSLPKITNFPCCPTRLVLPARCKESIVFRGGSTGKMCLITGD